MGKIDQLDDAVNHSVTDGQQGIHGAEIKCIDYLLPKHSEISLFSEK
jgi:hypothetical protein